MLALRRLLRPPVCARRAVVRSLATQPSKTLQPKVPLGEELKAPPSPEEEEEKYARVIKIGDKIYGVPAVKEGTIPTDLQQATGRRFDELIYELSGEVLFNRDPIYALPEQGTRENPVLVPSGEHERVVGFEDPVVHQVYWFRLAKDQLAYIPRIDKYFKLQPV